MLTHGAISTLLMSLDVVSWLCSWPSTRRLRQGALHPVHTINRSSPFVILMTGSLLQYERVVGDTYVCTSMCIGEHDGHLLDNC